MSLAGTPGATRPAPSWLGGQVVADALGLGVEVGGPQAGPDTPGAARPGSQSGRAGLAGLAELAGLALRDNPRRAHLVVSTVLGKHLPVAPADAVQAGHRLGALVRPLVGDGAPLVLGFCETATGLGHLVAEALDGAHCVHTTRRPDPGVDLLTGFDEEHSHAVEHLLQLADPAVLQDPRRPVVLVDDELTTGTTALNTVAALSAVAPGPRRWVVATLLDLRPPDVRAAFAARAAAMRVEVDVVALLSGALRLPTDAAERVAALRAALTALPPAPTPAQRGTVHELPGRWLSGRPWTGRTGVDPHAVLLPVDDLAAGVRPHLSGGPTLVLGTEELMRVPLRLAELLRPDVPTVMQSTTRSPVLAADLPGYAVRRVVHFPAPDEPRRGSRLHGLPDAAYADVVVVVDTPVAAARPLAEALRPWARERVLVVGP